MTGPLADITVLELGSTVAAPFCGRLLADFGANVIKIEALDGDPVRTMGSRRDGRSLYAASIFRNKNVLALDLNKPAGRDLVRRLAAQSDVMIENFRPGRLEQWGLDYKSLAAVNPGLVLARISGYGQDGPYRDRAGYGVTCEAVSGLRELTGDPDRPPARVAVSLTDEVAALYTAFGIMMALHERALSGRGQVVDTALYEAAFSLMEPHIPAYGTLGEIATRAGARLPGSAPNNLYPTADDGWVHITAISQPTFSRLCEIMGRPDLIRDPRFAKAVERVRHDRALDEIIAAWTRTLPQKDLEESLIDGGVPAARIYRMPDIFADPHFKARGMLVNVEDAELGTITLPGIVPKLSRSVGAVHKAGSSVGADGLHVLRDILKLSANELEALTSDGVVRLPEGGGTDPNA